MAEAMDTLRAQQFVLARHVRDPATHAPPPGIEDHRLAIYRDLFYNSIEGLLAGNFPVIRRTLDDAAWHALVRAFYAGHRCRTPLFTEIGREFVQFLEQRALEQRALEQCTQEQSALEAPPTQAGATDDHDPPWLAELAHYEWVELALQIADDDVPPHDPAGDLLAGRPMQSPYAWALAYRWPVTRIGPDYRPAAPPDAPTLLLVRRDAAGDVRFSQLSPLVYRLLELLGDDGITSGCAALQALAAEAAAADVPGFMQEGAAMLQRLRAEGALLGTQPG